MSDLNELWAATTQELAEIIEGAEERAYLRLTRLRSIVENTALLTVPDAFTRDLIESRMRAVITDVLSRRLGTSVQIAVVVNGPEGRAAALNPEPEPMVTRGVRLPASLDLRMREAADRAGVPFSQLIREWIELGLADMDDEQVVSLATLRRAIAHAAHSTANRPSP